MVVEITGAALLAGCVVHMLNQGIALREKDSLIARLEDSVEHERNSLAHDSLAHSEIEASLREQVQKVSAQLATIRVQHPGAAPDEQDFTPSTPPPEPLSEDLYKFVQDLDTLQSQEIVMEEIAGYRAAGVADEQIFQMIAGDK